MKFTVKQLFSIVDGRLSTEIGDVYNILNYVTSDNLMTHHLPVAINFIKQLRPLPDWWVAAEGQIEDAIDLVGNNFTDLMNFIDEYCDYEVEIEPLDAYQKIGFEKFMLDNSLLLKRFNS